MRKLPNDFEYATNLIPFANVIVNFVSLRQNFLYVEIIRIYSCTIVGYTSKAIWLKLKKKNGGKKIVSVSHIIHVRASRTANT